MPAPRQPNYYARRSAMHRSRAQNLPNHAQHKGFITAGDKLPMYHVLLAHFKLIPQAKVKAMQPSEAAQIFVKSAEFLERCRSHKYSDLLKVAEWTPNTFDFLEATLHNQELLVNEGVFFASVK